MAPKRVTTFRMDEDLLLGLKKVWERDGVQPGEQVRRATRAYLDAKGVMKTGRKRAVTRKRP